MSEYDFNLHYLSAGDRLLDGTVVPNETEHDGADNIQHARDVCEAYSNIQTKIQEHFTKHKPTGAWRSDSQRSLILLGPGEREDTVEEDYRIALEMLRYIDTIWTHPLIFECPLEEVYIARHAVRYAILAMEKHINGLRKPYSEKKD